MVMFIVIYKLLDVKYVVSNNMTQWQNENLVYCITHQRLDMGLDW